jgi:hypothetical protein
VANRPTEARSTFEIANASSMATTRKYISSNSTSIQHFTHEAKNHQNTSVYTLETENSKNISDYHHENYKKSAYTPLRLRQHYTRKQTELEIEGLWLEIWKESSY